MNEFEKDLSYVKSQILKSYTLDAVHSSERLWKHFMDKWSIRLSPTDPQFIKTKSEVSKMVEQQYTRISKAYL